MMMHCSCLKRGGECELRVANYSKKSTHFYKRIYVDLKRRVINQQTGILLMYINRFLY